MAKIIKGEKRGRPGKWIVDYRDHAGIRRWKTFDTKREAEDFYADRELWLKHVLPGDRHLVQPAMQGDASVSHVTVRFRRPDGGPSLSPRPGAWSVRPASGPGQRQAGHLRVPQVYQSALVEVI